MEDDGFKLVTGKKAANMGFKKAPNGTFIRVDGSLEDIEKAMKLAKQRMSKSGLGKWLKTQLEEHLEQSEHRKQSISTILLIGNGHFDRIDQAGAHQLALFLEISEFFNAEVVFQEPACSDAELEWLRTHKNLKIREIEDTNLEIDENPDSLTLFAMIHGPHNLFQGFLDFNWEKLAKNNNLIAVCNDYGDMNWALSKFSEGNERINEFYEISRICPFPAVYEPHNSAFSGTVVMFPVDKD